MRASEPIPCLTRLTFAPTASQRAAISFMKLIRVANIALAAYLVISAEAISMKITLKLFRSMGLYRRVISSRASSLSTPTTTLSGFIKSSIASPSFKNSGFDATSKRIATLRFLSSPSIAALTLWLVPTGTVLLVTTKQYLDRDCPILLATLSTCFRSAEPSSSDGVPTAMNTTSTSSKTLAIEV